MSSDERLVERATRGDRRAFEAIFRHYHQDLYRFCLAMVGRPQDAQDALQNTMVKVLRALPGEKRTIQLKPWLYRIARNESVEALRKRRDNAVLDPNQAVAIGVTETAETRERLRTLLADLEQLPERQRAVLVMRELSGLDFDQIGASFETSAAVARQTLYEARLSLRQLEAGREMRCTEVMRELSDGDGRVTRRREIRAHLHGCADCRAFGEDMMRRHDDLAAIAPLPLAASVALLHGVLGKAGTAVAGGSGLAGGVGAGAGKAVATSAIVKSAATAAVVAVVGVSAADRGGLIDVPLPGQSKSNVTQEPVQPASPHSVKAAEARAVDRRAPAATVGRANRDKALARAENARRSEDRMRTDPSRGDAAPGEGSDAPGEGSAIPGSQSSKSQAGLQPPGGGHGRSASKRNGSHGGPPDAAAQGQQTAAANKPPHAASPAGKGAAGGGPGNNADEAAPTTKASPPPKGEAPAAAPAAEAPPESPGEAGNGVARGQSGATPPGQGR